MVLNRTFTFGGYLYANNAVTPVPAAPVSGIAYRLGDEFDQTVIETGSAFNTRAQSARFNEAIYRLSRIAFQLESQGVLSWSATQEYNIGALVLAEDERLYRSLTDTNTGNDPTLSPSNWIAETNADAGGDVSGTFDDLTVTAIQGFNVSSATPSTNQYLRWSGSQWIPTAFPTSFPPSGVAGGDLTGTYPNPVVDQIQGRAWTAGAPIAGQYVYWNSSQFDFRSLPVASESVLGISERASQGETDLGTDDERHITPLKLHNKPLGGKLVGTLSNGTVTPATEENSGITRKASQAETNAGTEDFEYITPLKLASKPLLGDVTGTFSNTTVVSATETVSGKSERATQTETNVGTDDSRHITPLKLHNKPMIGDASGTISNTTVTAIQGFNVSSVTPSTNQYLRWSGSQWIPSDLPYALCAQAESFEGTVGPGTTSYVNVGTFRFLMPSSSYNNATVRVNLYNSADLGAGYVYVVISNRTSSVFFTDDFGDHTAEVFVDISGLPIAIYDVSVYARTTSIIHSVTISKVMAYVTP